MFTAYIVVTLLAVAANTYAATADFSRADWIVDSMTKMNVPLLLVDPTGCPQDGWRTGAASNIS